MLNAEANNEVDITALDASRSYARLGRPGHRLRMARVKYELRTLLDAVGFVEKLGEQHIYATLPTRWPPTPTTTRAYMVRRRQESNRTCRVFPSSERKPRPQRPS